MARLVRIATLALLACSCRGKPPANDAATLTAKVAELVPKVEQFTGLKFKRPPVAEVRSKAEVRAFLEKSFAESRAARELTGQEAAWKRFGMISDTLNLRKFLVELLSEQVVGFYDPGTKKLYLVNGVAPEAVGLVAGHELVHALQDQYVNLDSIQHAEMDNDHTAAAAAVIEGQAEVVRSMMLTGDKNIVARLPGGWDRVRQEIRDNQASMPVFARAPMVLQETVLFPYITGVDFMSRWSDVHPGMMPFGDLPQSTEQLLAKEKYFGTRDAPTTVTLPTLPGVTTTYSNNLGEFETRLFFMQHLGDLPSAVRAAAGWDGDRYAVVHAPQGEGIVWVSVWDTPLDAGEFYDALGEVARKRYDVKTLASTSTSKTFTTANARTVFVNSATVQGRPIVIWVDVPTGVRTDLVDVTKVGLKE